MPGLPEIITSLGPSLSISESLASLTKASTGMYSLQLALSSLDYKGAIQVTQRALVIEKVQDISLCACMRPSATHEMASSARASVMLSSYSVDIFSTTTSNKSRQCKQATKGPFLICCRLLKSESISLPCKCRYCAFLWPGLCLVQRYEESVVALKLLRQLIKLTVPQRDLIRQPVPLKSCVTSSSASINRVKIYQGIF